MIDVVAAVVVRDERILAAHRARPDEVGWEFPGGKLEAGEHPVTALQRECREELGVEVTVASPLASGDDGRVRMTVYECALASGEPRTAADHDELRWVVPEDLDGLDWLPLDRQLLPHVSRRLRKRIRQGKL